MREAEIDEIFASVQGEGLWIGQRHIFVRFVGCDIACRYCDTPSAATRKKTASPGTCRAQKSPLSFEFENVASRLSPTALTSLCSRLFIPGPGKRPTLSLTGGEPLLHSVFLSAWLPEIRKICTIYLETSGIHHEAMQNLREFVDIVSMDLKLPSATCLRPFWDEHARFLDAARGARLYGKTVVTADTTETDLLRAAVLLAGFGSPVPLVIQPADGPLAPEPEMLIRFQNAALGVIEDVRVIPQVHKMLRVP